MTTNQVCEDCGHTGSDVRDVCEYGRHLSSLPIAAYWRCDSCSETVYDRHQERLMEEGT